MMKALVLLTLCIIFYGTCKMQAQDGAPDPDFGDGDGLVHHSFFTDQPSIGYAIAVQEDQKIVVSGYTKGPDEKEFAFISRYEEAGDLDISFNGNGFNIPDIPGDYSFSKGVKIQPDGKIVMCVESSDSTGRKAWVFRYLTNGIPDHTFGDEGRVVISIGSKFIGVKALALQPDGKIVVGGYAGGDLRDSFFVIRLQVNGVLDNSFDGDGIVKTEVGESYTNISTLVLQPDGKIVAAGSAYFNGNEDFALVRYNTNGSLDQSFSDDGIQHITFSDGEDRIQSALIQPDNKIVTGGLAVNNVTGKWDFAAARFNPDGTLDPVFHGDGKTLIYITPYSDASYSMIRQPDGKIVLGGYVHSDAQAGGADLTLVRLNPDGTQDMTFDGDGIYTPPVKLGIETVIYKSALQPDGKIVSTGFYNENGLNQVMLFRTLTGLTTATQEVNEVITDIALYPNPVSENFVLKYSLENNEDIQVSICDASGRTVDQLLGLAERQAGYHEEHLKLNKWLMAGCYFVKMETSAGVKALRVMKE